MKYLYLILFCILYTNSTFAYDFMMDGIAYNVLSVEDLTAEVTYTQVANSYSGDIVIPPYVEYKNRRLTVTQIGNQSFYYCKSLTSISLPNTITSIVGCAFEYCTSLKSIVIPNSVKKIGSFDGCSSLYDIVLNDGVENLPILSNCTSLKKLSIPKNVKNISRSALEGTNLQYLYIEDGEDLTVYADYNEYYGSHVNHYGSFCAVIDTLHLNRKIKALGWKDKTDDINPIFPHVRNLIVGENINDITRIDYVIINSIKLLCSEPPKITEQTTQGYMNTQVTVPQGSIESYKSHSIWGKFWDLQENTSGNSKCATPVINFSDGMIKFLSETPNVKYNYSIYCSDATNCISYGNLPINGQYDISVYSSKYGYEDSNIAYATLVFSYDDSADNIDGIIRLPTTPLLISSNGSCLNIKGLQKSSHVEYYTINGNYLGSSNINNQETNFNPSLIP